MQPEDRSSRSSRSSKSSVWIDPAYMRHNPTGEQEGPSHSSQRMMSGEASRPEISTWQSPPAARASYRQPNPITPTPPTLDSLPGMASPVPPRASAQRGYIPRLPSPVWQYDSPDYEIESSIAALSLAIPAEPAEPVAPAASDPFPGEEFLLAELPTRPEIPAEASPIAELPTRPDHPGHRAGKTTPLLALAELDTVPPPLILSAGRDVPARPDPNLPTQALIPAYPTTIGPRLTTALPVPVGAQALVRSADVPAQSPGLASWTAGGAGQSRLAQRLIERPARRGAQISSSLHLNPLDRVRWWLLKPGRIEFLLWLAGTILLIVASLALLLATSLSFGWLAIGPLSRFSPSSSNNAHPLPTVVTYPGLKLTLLDKEPFLPGQSIRLHGQGFTPHGDIFFTYDHMQPFASQGKTTSMEQADAHGTFTVTLALGTGQQWYSGLHLIEARDLVSGHLAAVKILIIAPGSQSSGNGTGAPASTVTPGKGTPTPASSNGNAPTPGPGPGGQTPVPITPTATVGLTPTPTLSPSPTPTNTPTPTDTPTPTPPTPTPTPGITPTPTP